MPRIPDLMQELGIEGEVRGNNFRTFCPYHNDSVPSLDLDVEKEVFICRVCGSKGDLYAFIATKMGSSRNAVKKQLGMMEAGIPEGAERVSMDVVLLWHKQLTASKTYMDKLTELKGLDRSTVEKHMIGIDEQRYTIPVFRQDGSIANIRKWSPTDRKVKVISLRKGMETALYPISSMDSEEIFVTEGEMKALLLTQMGFPAVCSTGGASTWKNEWDPLFEDKLSRIVYDIDKPGRIGSNKVAAHLARGKAREIKVISLPLSIEDYPTGDVTDFVVGAGHTAGEFRDLVDQTKLWEPSPYTQAALDSSEVHDMHLARTSEARWCLKLVSSQVVVSAKDREPYILPAKIEVQCTRDQDFCVLCPVFNSGMMPYEFTVDPTHPSLLEMVGTTKEKVDAAAKKVAGIPKRCSVCRLSPTDTMNIEELRLIPQLQLQLTGAGNEHVVRRAFFVGHGTETNSPFIMTARVVPDPKTQFATLLVKEMQPSVDNLTTFSLTNEMHQALLKFQPSFWTDEALEAKLVDIYSDFEANVTRIYSRRDLHLFYDLVYHSVLHVNFQGKVMKGWAEGLVIGDSGQGKSESIKAMMAHYGLGEKIDSKGATEAGLLGGLQETSRRWFITWGLITLNDRRLVVLEEVKGMDRRVIARLTDMRSSGVAELSKIEHGKANARCRLIWISNPRSNRQILSYNYGVEAIVELIGSLEDVRRFDMAMVVSSGEVDKRFLNMREEDRPRREHVFKAEDCRNLLLWTWSREPDSVKFESEATMAVLEKASEMGDKYSSAIPLVEAADQRLKLARLSAALAARTYSCEDGKLVVRLCHVLCIGRFLDRLYNAPACGYGDYSKLVKGEDSLYGNKEIAEKLHKMSHAADVVRSMLEASTFTHFDLVDWANVDLDRARDIVGLLVRKNALRRGPFGYIKTPPFIRLLKELQMDGTLKNVESTHREQEF